ncbi:cytochrome c oxidase subunit 3 family protein [Streptomyces sp. CA-100214]
MSNTTDRARTAAPSVAGKPRRVPGGGVWILLFGDMVAFGIFFASFMFERAQQPELFEQSRHTLSTGIGLANTLVLLTSSLFVATAVRAIRESQNDAARLLIFGAMVCGVAFMVLKGFEWTGEVSAGHTPLENDFYLYYFILTGIHLIHVLFGIGALVLLLRLTQSPELGATSLEDAEAAGCFWHMVDALWIVIFPLLYLVS